MNFSFALALIVLLAPGHSSFDLRGLRCFRFPEIGTYMDFFTSNDHRSYKVNFKLVDPKHKDDIATIDTYAMANSGLLVTKEVYDSLSDYRDIITWVDLQYLDESQAALVLVKRSKFYRRKKPYVDLHRIEYRDNLTKKYYMDSPDEMENSFFFATHVVDFNCNYRSFQYGFVQHKGRRFINLYERHRSKKVDRLNSWIKTVTHFKYRFPKFIIVNNTSDLNLNKSSFSLIFYSDNTIALGNPRRALRLKHIPGVRQNIPVRQSTSRFDYSLNVLRYAPKVLEGIAESAGLRRKY